MKVDDSIWRASGAEIARRTGLVRAAKLAKAARGLSAELTIAELDALIPPVDCRRTRCRQMGLSYRRTACRRTRSVA